MDTREILAFLKLSFCSSIFSLDHNLPCFILCKWLYFTFLSTFLQNLIFLIAFCYWQYFSAFTSYLALGKGNKESIGWIILKLWRSIFPQIFLPHNLPLLKHPSLKFVYQVTCTHISIYSLLFISKCLMFNTRIYVKGKYQFPLLLFCKDLSLMQLGFESFFEIVMFLATTQNSSCLYFVFLE